ncbi:HAD family hydrolase [Streptomyces sp. NPDC057740]|uniref:HAD family hydrolase n=1 Tax=Streptomyces sp. NPDC057740 TaxID=3346234 RepID=UPI003692D77D
MPADLADATDVRDLLTATRCVLFDFDGPICRLFPRGASASVADELRAVVAKFGAEDLLTAGEQRAIDPHVVLRAVHRARSVRDVAELLDLMEERLTAGEVDAARRAWPTPYADVLIERLAERQVRMAVVTNNAPEAAWCQLGLRGLRGRFAAVHGRTDPGLMKPDPHVVLRALDGLGLAPDDAVMIGDTEADVRAAERAGVRFIGYGRNARKVKGLRDAGASVVITSYLPLVARPWGAAEGAAARGAARSAGAAGP